MTPIIEKIVNLIVPLVEPDKIILFGSYARGDNTERSDIDIMVLKRELGKKMKAKLSIKYTIRYT